MRPRDPSINITYGIITMIYLSVVIIINTLNISVYEQDVLIPLLVPEVCGAAPAAAALVDC